MSAINRGFRGFPKPPVGPDAALGGSLVLLNSQSTPAASVATMEFVDVFTAAYVDYELHIHALEPATDAQDLWVRLGNFRTFDAGASDYLWNSNRSTSAGVNSVIGSSADTKITTAINLTNTGGPFHLVIRISYPALGGLKKSVMFDGGYQQSAAGANRITGSGYYTTSTKTFSSMQIQMSSGNFGAATYLYARKRS